jgi:hypothetical protein
MEKNDLETLLKRVKTNLRVTKVVATRSYKTGKGDFFAGFAAAWNTVQDDAGGPGADMDLIMSALDQASGGMTLKEASVAHNILAMQADIGAFRAARANQALSAAEMEDAIATVKNNYSRIIRDALTAPAKSK